MMHFSLNSASRTSHQNISQLITIQGLSRRRDMTNSEDTSTGDNLSTINPAKKVTDSFSSSGSAHPNQLGGDNSKEPLDDIALNGSGTDTWDGGSDISGDISVDHRMDDHLLTRVTSATSTRDGHSQTDTTIQASTSQQPALPFRLICGESLEYECDTTEGILALTNYRLFIKGKNTTFNIPIGVIEQVENRDIFFLHVSGKDGRCIRCTFPNNETATETMKRIQMAISSPKNMKDTFAFTFFTNSSSQEESLEEIRAQLGLRLDVLPQFPSAKERFDMEIKRMEFNVHGPWRISDENSNYDLCGSYPTHIIVPSSMTKKHLEQVACFRSARRFPAVVWRLVDSAKEVIKKAMLTMLFPIFPFA